LYKRKERGSWCKRNKFLSKTEGKHGKETCVIHQNDLQTNHASNKFLSKTEGKHGKETYVIHQNGLQTKHSSTASDTNKPALILEK
jgi:hypothetical protein